MVVGFEVGVQTTCKAAQKNKNLLLEGCIVAFNRPLEKQADAVNKSVSMRDQKFFVCEVNFTVFS